MEALDPIDVMHVQAGYYTNLPVEVRERYPLLVSLGCGDGDGVDPTVCREAFARALHDRLENEFPEAGAIDIVCVDGTPPAPSLTEVSLSRPTEERTRIARRLVDALALLTWAQGRWMPQLAGDYGSE
jgi:hypothetical protein